MSLSKLGRYDLLRVLGKGAMGLVYEGHDPNLNRRVAIKTIQVEYLSQEAGAEYEFRFRTEAHSAARLQHPNIVSVYDADRDGGVAYLVMEFIQGQDLKQHLDSGVVYSLAQSVAMVCDLLSALDYAHQHNIVHRDIKPANLLLQVNGRVKLTDFGVARLQDTADMTRTQGAMVGTLKYMSPEQVQGLPIDSRADLFSAGVVLYQLLANHRPFDGGSDFAIIHEIIDHQPSAPSNFNPRVPPALDAVVAKALAKSPDQRFATAREFALALQAAVKQEADRSLPLPFGIFGVAEGARMPLHSPVDAPTAAFEPTQRRVLPIPSPPPQAVLRDLDRELGDLSIHSSTDTSLLFTARPAPLPLVKPATKPAAKSASKPTITPTNRWSGRRIFALFASLAVVLIGLGLKLPWLYSDEPVSVPISAVPPPIAASEASSTPASLDATTAATPAVPAARAASPVLPTPQGDKGVKGGNASVASPFTHSSTVLNNSSTTVPKLMAVLPKPRATGADATSILSTANVAAVPPQSATSQPAVGAASSSARPVTANPLASSDADSPEDACGNRVLLGRYSCMMVQCAKPLFQAHPACVEIQQIEQRRRDNDAQRY